MYISSMKREADIYPSSSAWHGVAVLEPRGRIVTRYESLVYQEPAEHTAVFIEGDDAPFFYRRHR